MTRAANLALAPRARHVVAAKEIDTARDRGVGSPQRRIALYSHDTQGLGHVRRNTMLAAAVVAADPGAQVLLVSGAREASSLPMPDRTRIAFIPGLAKDGLGYYSARRSGGTLDHVVGLRAAALDEALSAFAPHLLVVDKVARGFRGELEPALRRLRRTHGTRTALGLRDVLDDVEATRQDWECSRSPEAVDALYDEVWVYGDPAIFDPVEEYGWGAATRAKVRYTGYLARGREQVLTDAAARTAADAAPLLRPQLSTPYVLGLVGGGQDGAAVADAFAAATYPAGHTGVLVTGPYLPERDLARVRDVAGRRSDLRVHRFVGDVPALARGSAATVSMGGYNSVCELIASPSPALVVPRTSPRREQSLRAARFEEHGLVDVLSLDDLAPDAVGRWLGEAVTRPRRDQTHIDLEGLRAVPALASALLDTQDEQEVRHVG
ncbi:MAG TPA: hypothetical protein VFR45_06480 [Nocardioides sp.]|jgi:predicted glycosyltransferase|nr:hypothetical protein [Nocardioides sp.]